MTTMIVNVRDRVVNLPDQMTVDAAYEERAIRGEGHIIKGRPLTYCMVRYLDDALAGLSVEERFLQMEQINPPVALTWQLRRAGHPIAQIADCIGVSVRTIYNRLERADRFMGRTPDAQTDEQRLRNLEIDDPQAHTVYILYDFRWSYEQIADWLGCSPSTVKRALGRARTALGTVSRRSLNPYARREIIPAAGSAQSGP